MLENWQQQLEFLLNHVSTNFLIQILVLIPCFVILALIIDRSFIFLLKLKTTKKSIFINHQSLEYLHRPLFSSVLLLGGGSVVILLKLSPELQSFIFSVLSTIAIIIWTSFVLKSSKHILKLLANNPKKISILHSQTLPLFENIAFILIIGLATFYIFVNWNIDMTAWLASAGIIGIAVGFAAKDSLANLFSGVFIMADAPYKIGDFVVLDSGERGEITRIGIRSTRLLTRDDVEVTVPNSVMGNTKIINESGGLHEKFRIAVRVGVAYGTDIDKVRDILMSVGENNSDTCQDPEPKVRFRQFGGSSLDFDLLCWVEKPVLRGRVLDSLNCEVYKAFNNANIEIPYAKQDVYIKEMPSLPKKTI